MINDSKHDSVGLTAQNNPKKPGLIEQWGGRRAFFFTYVHLSHDLTTGLLAALLPFIRTDLNLSYLQTGFLVSAFSITSGLSQILGGWAADRIGRQKGIALGLGGIGLGAIAISLAPSYYVLLGILIGLGVFAGFYHPSAISTVTTIFDADKRGRVVALHMIGGSFGFAAGPVLGALIARYLNWHWAYAILGIPAIIACLLVLTKFKLPDAVNQRRAKMSPKGDGTPRIGVWQVFKPVVSIVALSVSLNLMSGPVMSFASLYMVDVHHLSAAAGSMWVTLIRAGGVFGSLAGGWLSDKWGRRNAIFLNLVLFGPVIFLIARLNYGVALGAALIIFGGLLSMRETNMQAYLMDQCPPELRATIIGIYFGFGQQGSSLIQPIAGDIMDVKGISWVYSTISYITLLLSAIAMFFAFGNRKSRNNTPAANPQ